MKNIALAFLWLLDLIFIVGVLGVVASAIRTVVNTRSVLAGVWALAWHGFWLCFVVAVLGAVLYGFPPKLLFERYTKAFPQLVAGWFKDLGSENKPDKKEKPAAKTSQARVLVLYKKGSTYYGKSVEGTANVTAENGKGVVKFLNASTTNFKFSSGCVNVAGGTRCDIAPVFTNFTKSILSKPVEWHVVVTPPLPDVPVLSAYDPKQKPIAQGAVQAAPKSASELGKVCRILLPANLPPGDGLVGEGTGVHNFLQTFLCVIFDLTGTVARARAQVTEKGTPTEQYINSVQQGGYYYGK